KLVQGKLKEIKTDVGAVQRIGDAKGAAGHTLRHCRPVAGKIRAADQAACDADENDGPVKPPRAAPLGNSFLEMKESLSKPPSGQPQVDSKKEGDEKAAHSADAKAPEDGTNPQRTVTQLGKPQPISDEP